MASAKLQKPTNKEHRCSEKISEMTAWGTKVFGHKQHHAVAKHCNTCQCPAPKDTKPMGVDAQKKDSKQTAGAELRKKEKRDNHTKITMTNTGNTLGKKVQNDEVANHCFSSMADHWKEKIMMMKKGKDKKSRDGSSSSDSENESSEIKKTHKRHSQETKTTSK